MGPNEVNGIVPRDPGQSVPPSTSPAHGQIQTADFMVTGDLKLAFQHLKDMFEPRIESQSGPIKPMTQEELDREKQQPLEDRANSIPPTITSL